MNPLWLTGGLLFFVGACIVAIFLKRSLGIAYDRKSLVAPFLGLLVIAVAYLWGDTSPIRAGNFEFGDRIWWTVILLLAINGVLQFVFWFFWAIVKRMNWFRLPRFVFNLGIVLLMIISILIIIRNIWDTELTALLVTSTVLSAIIGLSLQDTLGNFFAGISLQLEAPFNIDDWVNLGGFEGKVVSQNWRTLTLLTRQHHRVSLTNKFVAEDKIVNYSRPTRRQIHNFSIVLDYQHPPNLVKKVLIDIIEEIEEVDPHQTLGAFVIDYMDSGIKYGIKYWINDIAYINEIHDIVLTRLWYALERNKIKIPYPTTEVQFVPLKEGLSEAERKLEKDNYFKFLNNLEWLKELDDAQIITLTEGITSKKFAKNDVIIQQGDEGDAMCIIFDGKAKVFLTTDGRTVEVAEKLPGEFFGEMSLLTGEPRSASVRAAVDMEVLVIEKSNFNEVLAKDELILKDMIDGMYDYKSGLNRIIEEERQRNDTTRESATQIVLQKIKRYLEI